jgi:hypothetical protein
MISKVVSAKAIDKKSRILAMSGGGASDNTCLINRRHYLGGTGTYTLYQGGASTAWPYAYGSIPVPFDCYFSSLTMTANKYSSYGTPTGNSVTIRIYKNDHLTLLSTKTVSYTPSQNMRLTIDFGTDVELNADDKVWVRWQANGIWRYVDSTVILTER